jgi:hypothetical protein
VDFSLLFNVCIRRIEGSLSVVEESRYASCFSYIPLCFDGSRIRFITSAAEVTFGAEVAVRSKTEGVKKGSV